MNAHSFDFRGETFHALPSGALFWPSERLLAVSDLHLGKAERAARRGGPMLPPYEGIDTLLRLSGDISATTPRTVVCLWRQFRRRGGSPRAGRGHGGPSHAPDGRPVLDLDRGQP